jgi:hypothetical protein
MTAEHDPVPAQNAWQLARPPAGQSAVRRAWTRRHVLAHDVKGATTGTASQRGTPHAQDRG